MRISTMTCAGAALSLAIATAGAQPAPGPATTAGPGRITCKTATQCQLGIGEPAKIKYQINVEALPAADKDRLNKQCAPSGKTPCVVTVKGTEMGDSLKVKAASITFHN